MILVTGNKGMLGTDVEIWLKINNMPAFFTDLDVDIVNLAKLREFVSNKDIKWIINCAAYTAVDKAETQQDLARSVNAIGIQNIGKVAKEKDAKVIHISTDYVFDGLDTSEYKESMKINPQTVYGKTKAEGEELLFKETDKAFILRTSWLYGKYGNNFIFTILRLLNEKSILEIVDDQTGSPTYTKDLVNALAKIIQQDSHQYGIYHFSNRNKTDWFEFADTIYKLALKYNVIPRTVQKDVRLVPISSDQYITSAKRPQNSYLNCSKFETVFQYKIRNWKDALDDFMQGLKK